jgi:hypothetical protein
MLKNSRADCCQDSGISAIASNVEQPDPVRGVSGHPNI